MHAVLRIDPYPIYPITDCLLAAILDLKMAFFLFPFGIPRVEIVTRYLVLAPRV